MIKEAYCNYEISKLLVEKGFNPDLVKGQKITHQMAMAWLREEHGIEIWSEYSMVDEAYVYTILIKSFIKGFTYIHSAEKYSAYEEAVEAALKYSLENLI